MNAWYSSLEILHRHHHLYPRGTRPTRRRRRRPSYSWRKILWFVGVRTATAVASVILPPSKPMNRMIIIDSHLHVWANSLEAKTAFPFPDPGKEPPPALKEMADTESLRRQMKLANVDGALIVQPINHLFDHRYVTNAIRKYPHIFKGMLLHDPSMNPNDAIRRVEDLALQGFVGVRFNPYLWPSKSSSSSSLQQQQQHFHENMSEGSGLAVYQRCAELNMPVGIMCFHGIHWHYEDILQLIQKSPQTKLILDHFGFTRLDKPETFTQLLSLSKYPNVHVKISALFRLHDTYPYDTIKTRRFRPLLDAFGSERLLYGSDFPYVLEQPTGYEQVRRNFGRNCRISVRGVGRTGINTVLKIALPQMLLQ